MCEDGKLDAISNSGAPPAGRAARNTPVAPPDVEINSLQTAIRAQYRCNRFPSFKWARGSEINRGFLAGVEGIFMSFKKRVRLVLSIPLLQESVLLEVDRDPVSTEQISDRREGGPARPFGITSS